MAAPYFQFKRFHVFHDRCAMKVGTDGVLLGAWVQVDGSVRYILDVGTGSGLIAIMLAQRCDAQIQGVDVVEEAVEQARENAARTPWNDRMAFVRMDYLTCKAVETYDLIVSNPPFYVNALSSPDPVRNQARNAESLPFERMMEISQRALKSGGRLALVVPAEHAHDVVMAGWERGLNLLRKTSVYKNAAESHAVRCLLEFKKGRCSYPETQRLDIHEADGTYTEQYKILTGDFYLQF